MEEGTLMKKSLIFLFLIFFLYGCANHKKQEAPLRVGLVFDVGGRGDKSFNDSAYRGLERARREFSIYYEYIEPGEGADRESALRLLATRDFELILGIGFMFSSDITTIAGEFPDRMFACVDYAVREDVPIPPNLAALKFKEEEGAFLIGALAGMMTKTDKVGFVGGMDIPLINKFEAGYRFGVKKVNPRARVLVGYAGVTGEAFKNPAKGKELAYSQYGQGADIIFHASGSTGLGVFEAAREKDRWAIGVDADQYREAPRNILTSMVKRVDLAVYQTIKDVLENNFKGGITAFGLKNDGVGYVSARFLEREIKNIEERLESLKSRVSTLSLNAPEKSTLATEIRSMEKELGLLKEERETMKKRLPVEVINRVENMKRKVIAGEIVIPRI